MVDSRYTEDEATILRHFFTNIRSDTYFLKNFPDFEVAALFVASYSRNKKELRDMFLDTILNLDVIEPHNKVIKNKIRGLKKQNPSQQTEDEIKNLESALLPDSATELREKEQGLVKLSFAKWAEKITNVETSKDSKELMEMII